MESKWEVNGVQRYKYQSACCERVDIQLRPLLLWVGLPLYIPSGWAEVCGRCCCAVILDAAGGSAVYLSTVHAVQCIALVRSAVRGGCLNTRFPRDGGRSKRRPTCRHGTIVSIPRNSMHSKAKPKQAKLRQAKRNCVRRGERNAYFACAVTCAVTLVVPHGASSPSCAVPV